MSLGFTGERIVPGAVDCEPTFAQKMYQEHVARYAFAAQYAGGKDILDVGCGVGYGSQWLAKAGAKSVLGIDLSDEAIEHARHNYYHPAVSFKQSDATAIVRGEGYDLVTCFELIEHIEQQETVLDLIKDALRDDGILAISTPRPLDDIRTHFHVHEMSFEELFGLLKQRFKYVEPFFERNCFTSFVGRECPTKIESVISVSDKIGMDHADYFVFLASDAPIEGKRPATPVITLNDDSYILTLEKDVGVLRQAENDHLARIHALDTEKQALMAEQDRHSTLTGIQQETLAIKSSVADMRNQLSRLSEVEQLRGRIAELEGKLLESDVAAARNEASELRQMLFESQNRLAVVESNANASLMAKAAEYDALAREADSLRKINADQERDLDAVRRAIADVSSKLADAETQANAMRGQAERLPEALARASALESELNALRYRLDHAEATLARFRNSLSWALTRPVRWIGRTFKKITGRSQQQ